MGIDQAFKAMKRENFLPEGVKHMASIDAPLNIGFEQTNSQPTTVRMMLGWLDVEPGQKILDVGSGSGWTTALLSYLAGPQGNIIAVEKEPDLVEFGRQNCQRLGIKNAIFHHAGKTYGWPKQAPYDRILVSAAADKLPQALVDQLGDNGSMVIPLRHSIWVITKDKKGNVEQEEYPGFVFVPLI